MTKIKASFYLLLLLVILLVFHFLILVKIIPYDQVWGGNIHSEKEMLQFELVGVLITLLMTTAVYLHYRNLKKGRSSKKVLRIFLWVVFAYFLLNTLANLAAESIWEMVLGTAISLFAAGLCWWSVKGKEI